VNDLAHIRRSTHIPIATGEHAYTRWGFLQLLQAEAVDVIQADPDWCGGISELVKICNLASAYGRTVVPHGHSINAALQTIAAQSPETCPMAEYIWKTQPMKQWFHKDYVEPENGAITLPSRPGLGIELDTAKITERVEL
jgi:L-alanine-DL-glutamate epimerase-like enolase superfamily enzyme